MKLERSELELLYSLIQPEIDRLRLRPYHSDFLEPTNSLFTLRRKVEEWLRSGSQGLAPTLFFGVQFTQDANGTVAILRHTVSANPVDSDPRKWFGK